MPDLKAEVKSILARHEGPGNSIKGKELASLFGHRDDRLIRLVIREVISEGIPVAGGSDGYYIITSRQQAEAYAESIKGRLIEDARRRRDFRKAADMWLTPAEQKRLL